jgi:hypothetical protein
MRPILPIGLVTVIGLKVKQRSPYTLITALSNTQNKQTINTHAHIQTHTKDDLNHQMRSIAISTYELNTVFNISFTRCQGCLIGDDNFQHLLTHAVK